MQWLFSHRRSTMAPAANSNTTQQSRLQDIIFLLHNKRESLAASRSRLSLTSRQIQDICSALYSSSLHSQNTESSSLHNLLSNVKAIKIVPEPASSSLLLNETINLSPFHQLTHLEVRNVPVFTSSTCHNYCHSFIIWSSTPVSIPWMKYYKDVEVTSAPTLFSGQSCILFM